MSVGLKCLERKPPYVRVKLPPDCEGAKEDGGSRSATCMRRLGLVV